MTREEVISALGHTQEIIERIGVIAKEYGYRWEEWDEIAWDEVNLDDPDEATITIRWTEYSSCCGEDGYEEAIPISLLWDNNFITKIKIHQAERRLEELERVKLDQIRRAESALRHAEQRAEIAQEEADQALKNARQKLAKLRGE
jgi:hypothetical protein